MGKFRKIWFVAGRVLVGLFYILTGANHFLALRSVSAYAASRGVPAPSIAVVVSGLLLLNADITFLLGLKPELGIVALVVFFIPVSFMMHPFWSMPGDQVQPQMINFIKNMALLGSALVFAAVPRPWPVSVDAKLAEKGVEGS